VIPAIALTRETHFEPVYRDLETKSQASYGRFPLIFLPPIRPLSTLWHQRHSVNAGCFKSMVAHMLDAFVEGSEAQAV
jgi:hypothetical protein